MTDTSPESDPGQAARQAPLQDAAPVSFSQAAQEQQPGLIREFFEFLWESKSWWITPILIVLALVAVLVALSSSVVAPFIYPIF